MLGEEEGPSGDLTGRSSGRQSDGCDRTMRSGGDGDLSLDKSEFLRKRNTKEGGEWMCQCIMRLPTPFIGWRRVGETVPWRRIGRRREEFFNAFISRRREEGAASISEGERSTQGGSWFPRGGATGGSSSVRR
jgi:hypothetical protein